jgi:hypothetical protein
MIAVRLHFSRRSFPFFQSSIVQLSALSFDSCMLRCLTQLVSTFAPLPYVYILKTDQGFVFIWHTDGHDRMIGTHGWHSCHWVCSVTPVKLMYTARKHTSGQWGAPCEIGHASRTEVDWGNDTGDGAVDGAWHTWDAAGWRSWHIPSSRGCIRQQRNLGSMTSYHRCLTLHPTDIDQLTWRSKMKVNK